MGSLQAHPPQRHTEVGITRFLLFTSGLVLLVLPSGPVSALGSLVIALSTYPLRSRLHVGSALIPVCFAAWCLISMGWSIAPGESLNSGVRLALVTLAAVSAATRLDWEFVGQGIAVASSIVAAACLTLGFGFDRGWMPDGTLAGIYPHSNVLGLGMALGTFSGLLAVMQVHRATPLLPSAVCLVALINTGSATSIAALLSSFLVVIALACCRLTGPTRSGIALLSVLSTAVTLLAAMPWWLSTVTTAIGRDATLTGRTTIWPAIWQIIQQRPWLGVGYRAAWVEGSPLFAETSSLLGFRFVSTHNAALELWLGVGIIGLALYVWMIGRSAQTWCRIALTDSTRSRGTGFGIGMLALLVIHGVAESGAAGSPLAAFLVVFLYCVGPTLARSTAAPQIVTTESTTRSALKP